MTQRQIINLVETTLIDKIINNPNYIRYTFYEVNVKYSQEYGLEKQDIEMFLQLLRAKLKNDNYQIYSVEKYSINKLSKYEVDNLKFIKVMFGTASKAGTGFEYKIDEINETDNWHPETMDGKEIGGFNFSVEEKILRWLVRGDTLYDVIIPENTDVYDCESPSAPHGVFRSNKIIVTNPRPVTDEIAMNFYKKSILPEKSYFKSMAGCAIRGYINTAVQIFKDKVNKENVNFAFDDFRDFITPNDKEDFSEEYLGEDTKKIYDMFIALINM